METVRRQLYSTSSFLGRCIGQRLTDKVRFVFGVCIAIGGAAILVVDSVSMVVLAV